MMNQKIAGLLKIADLSLSMQDEIRRQQPIAAAEQQQARDEIARLKRDREWTKRLLNGGRDETSRWTRLHQIITMPTATTAVTYPDRVK
jgi:hypothetical protein